MSEPQSLATEMQALRARHAELSDDALRELWTQSGRLFWAEAALSDELLKRGVTLAWLESVERQRKFVPPPSPISPSNGPTLRGVLAYIPVFVCVLSVELLVTVPLLWNAIPPPSDKSVQAALLITQGLVLLVLLIPAGFVFLVLAAIAHVFAHWACRIAQEE